MAKTIVTIDRKELKNIIVPIFKAKFRCIPLDEEIEFLATKVEEGLSEKVAGELAESKLRKLHAAFLKEPSQSDAQGDDGKDAVEKKPAGSKK